MKKIFAGLLVGSLLLVGSVFAAEVVEKDANSTFEVSATEVLTGETVEMTVTTEKKGSSYTITWTGATEGVTTLTEDGYYVSDATFSSEEEGNFEVGYSLVMKAGKSHVTWVDGDKVSIEVTAPETGEESNGPKGNNGVGTGSKAHPKK